MDNLFLCTKEGNCHSRQPNLTPANSFQNLTGTRFLCLGLYVVSFVNFFAYAEKPNVTVEPKHLVVNANDVAIFTCYGRGEPTPSITWNTTGLVCIDIPKLYLS